MRYFLIYLIFSFTSFHSFSQDEKANVLSSFQKSEFDLVYDTSRISGILKMAYCRHYSERFYFANPGKVFNNTDMADKTLPNQRLIFGGISRDSSLFILYFQSGGDIGPENILLLLKPQSSSVFELVECRMFASDITRDIAKLKKKSILSESRLFSLVIE